jgi:hypothetical protein
MGPPMGQRASALHGPIGDAVREAGRRQPYRALIGRSFRRAPLGSTRWGLSLSEPSTARVSSAWNPAHCRAGKRRDMGLGSCTETSLLVARASARARALAREGGDRLLSESRWFITRHLSAQANGRR